MSIGTSDVVPGSRLTVRGGVGTVLRLEAEGSSVSQRETALAALAEAPGAMADGFGPQLLMQVAGEGGTGGTLALIGAERTGGDRSGSLVFHTSDAGSTAERLRIDPRGRVDLNGALALKAQREPPVSGTGEARIAFDAATGKLQVSENGGAWADLLPEKDREIDRLAREVEALKRRLAAIEETLAPRGR
jgi:hypothetical protein